MGQLKLLLIGANGFVGSNIYSLLHDHYNITTIGSADKVDFSDLNRVDNLLKDLRPDVVINCLTYGQKQTNGDMALEVAKNTAMFYNFLHCQNSFAQYINIGSGAEFDRTKNIDLALELDIHKVMPTDSYGFAKNLIARAIQTVGEKFITLRLFGCFGKNEWSSRFLKRFCSAGDKFVIDNDRYFDYISVDDFVAIIKFTIDNRITGHDLNCVYDEKLKLSEILEMFCSIHGIDKTYTVGNTSQFHYTANNQRLNYYKDQIDLKGLSQGLKNYL